MEAIKKIVILGPESTGKSTLCQQLAKHYNTSWVPEYARKYLLDNGMNYTYNDLLSIAKGQVALEEQYFEELQRSIQQPNILAGRNPAMTNQASPLFIDTNLHVMKVWCEFVFEKCHDWILDQIAARLYDLYLLCNIDLPWVKDELREYPDLESRQKLFHIYKDMMVNQAIPWIQISGDYDQRLQKAVVAVDHLLATH